MKAEVLAKCGYAELVGLQDAYWTIMRIYENAAGGPARAASYKEYLVIRQNYNQVRLLISELAE